MSSVGRGECHSVSSVGRGECHNVNSVGGGECHSDQVDETRLTSVARVSRRDASRGMCLNNVDIMEINQQFNDPIDY